VGWRHEPPYDFYDYEFDPPVEYARWRAAVGDDGRLEANWYFACEGDVVEVGIGLRPDLIGRGLGERYMDAQLEYARGQWAPRRFRLYVASWNERAIRLYERLGFREAGTRHTRAFERFGEHEFMRMERDA
jgi:RimJ/RimL family protein N-acetyltransferase